MNNSLHTFSNTALPEDLYPDVLKRIYGEKRKLFKRRLWYVGASLTLSFAALVETFSIMIRTLSQSGFYSYFSLFFSDGFTLLSYWKEFSLSLLESFSFSEAIILFACAFMVLFLVRSIVKNIQRFGAAKFTYNSKSA